MGGLTESMARRGRKDVTDVRPRKRRVWRREKRREGCQWQRKQRGRTRVSWRWLNLNKRWSGGEGWHSGRWSYSQKRGWRSRCWRGGWKSGKRGVKDAEQRAGRGWSAGIIAFGTARESGRIRSG